VQFHCALGPFELCPIEQAGTQIDGRSIQAHQFVLETKLAAASHGLLTLLQQLLKHGLIQFPWPMFVGVREGGALGRLPHPQMRQFSFTTGQPAHDLSQRLGLSQLAEQHRDQLRPASEALRMLLSLMLLNCLLELGSRQEA